ncbi:MAG: hypothetical protein ACBR50_07530 [Microcoleus sp.]
MTIKLFYGIAIEKLSHDGRSGSTDWELGIVLSQIIVTELDNDPKIG